MRALPPRFGAIGDVHGEHLLLELALRELRSRGASHILAVGDILDGPGDVERCVELLSAPDVTVVRGNHEPRSSQKHRCGHRDGSNNGPHPRGAGCHARRAYLATSFPTAPPHAVHRLPRRAAHTGARHSPAQRAVHPCHAAGAVADRA